MKSYRRLIGAIFVLLLVNQSCEKKPTAYRAFLDGHEVIYPGKAQDVQVRPGDNRLLLTWVRGSDPSIKKYVVYWNERGDSLVVDVGTDQISDTIRAYINNLPEGFYSFSIFSVDEKGNRSVPVSLENVKSFGNQYQSGLLNRAIDAVNYLGSGELAIYWGAADTINVNTLIKYTTGAGETKMISLKSDQDTLVISDWKFLTSVSYHSSYIPVQSAVDTFAVLEEDSVKFSQSILPVPKPWNEMKLPYDVNTYNSSLTMHWLWDGMPAGYPNIFHSARGSTMPQTFSFDLGQVYTKLTQFEEWGRMDPVVYTNPINFEVWGIADTTNAIPLLAADDPKWADVTIAKGWTLLADVKRPDVNDGRDGYKVDLVDDPPPVRFIRIRVKSTTNPSSANLAHESELSFWYAGLDFSY